MGPQRRFEKGIDTMDEEIITEIERVRAFWIDFWEDILDQLSEDIPICNYVPVEAGIVLEQVRYKKYGKDKIYTQWLRKPLKSQRL